MPRFLQSPVFWLLLLLLIACGGLAATAREYWLDPLPSVQHPAIRITAYSFVALWAAALALMVRLAPGDWMRPCEWRRIAQLAWSLAYLLFLVHVAFAFHLGHGWSHAAAFEHTRQSAGVGAGVYVNYLFGLVWGFDVVWFAGFPVSYARRPRWLAGLVHGFMAFMVFNATIVFGTLWSKATRA